MGFETTSRIYLTGGTGFLGNQLRAALWDANQEVTVLARNASAVSPFPNETIQTGNILSRGSLDMSGHDLVIHLAAQTSIERALSDPVDTWEVNADGTSNVLDTARAAGVDRFIFASSASVYGEPEYLPIDEGHPTAPTEPYAASKLAGDALVRSYEQSYDISTAVLRLFNVYGPGQPAHNVVPTIVEQALAGETVELGNLSPSRDFIYVADAIRAMLFIIKAESEYRTFNIGTGNDHTIRELAEAVADIVDKNIEIKSTVERSRDDSIEIPRHVADVARLESLGWSSKYDIRDGLEETVSTLNSRDKA